MASGGSGPTRRAAIIGGGIGGFAAALALRKSFDEVVVYEKAPIIAEMGAGLQISANGVAALRWLGLGGALPAILAPLKVMEVRRAKTGRKLVDLTLPDSAPILPVHRSDLLILLNAGARQRGVRAQLGHAISAGDLDADLVVAADGIHSGHVSDLGTGQSVPPAARQVAFRALLPLGDLPRDRLSLHLGHGHHVVTYPLVLRGFLNLVAVVDTDLWQGEGWTVPSSREDMVSALGQVCPDLAHLLSQAETVYQSALPRRGAAPVWQDGRTVLLGDAAHPTLPFLAQGANLALEDAVVLGRLIAEKPQSEALFTYERLRKARRSKVVRASERNGWLYHLSGPLGAVTHLGLASLGAVAPRAMLLPYRFIPRYNAATLPI